MTGRKRKCAQTEFQCPLMSIHSQEYNYWCQFFYSSMLFETSKCLYYKFITYIPNMGYGKAATHSGPNLWVALSSFSTLCIRFQLRWRLYLQWITTRHHPDSPHGTFPASQQNTLEGNKKPARHEGFQKSHGIWAEMTRIGPERQATQWAQPVPGSSPWARHPCTWMCRPSEHRVTVWFLIRAFRESNHTQWEDPCDPCLSGK